MSESTTMSRSRGGYGERREHGGWRERGGYLDRPSSASLADVVEMILDKGLVIDAFVRVALVGIEVLTIDARIVIASVDTYLRFAEATNRLDLMKTGPRDLPGLVSDMTQSAASSKTKGVIGGLKDALTGSQEDKSQQEPAQTEPARPRQRPQSESRPARRKSEEG